MKTTCCLTLAVLLAAASVSRGDGEMYTSVYRPSDRKGALVIGVKFHLWIPPGVKAVRGVIVHQHGCGSGACKGGETAALDLQWRELARKWGCALLGPSYQQDDKQSCRLWCDPRNGSGKVFLEALADLARQSKHPEIEAAPWCLWGHSGGAFWASLMHVAHPERCVALWLRSGTAFGAWEKGEIEKPVIPPAAYLTPVMLNPGAKEKGDKRFGGLWDASLAMHRAYRARGGLVGFAPDPRTAHECGDSRHLAIRFFDECLKHRLPEKPGGPLRAMPHEEAWLAEPLGKKASPAKKHPGKVEESAWLPSAAAASAWAEYVEKGHVTDSTPPPAPTNVRVAVKDGKATVTWEARADLESGIRQFILLRDGKEVGRLPEKPVGRFGRPQFQAISYHDTPEQPVLAMRWADTAPGKSYQVVTVNGEGKESKPSPPASP
jgi:poly(3-hydroxybutyrate) depolymerase